MQKLWINFFILMTACLLLNGCSNTLRDEDLNKNHKKTEYMAMLTDPIVRKDFRALKVAAKKAHLYKQNGKTYIAPQDLQKLNVLSQVLVDQLHYQYHMNPTAYKVHTYIGRNQYNSCYQYYNSLDKDSMNKSCSEFSSHFSSCELCDQYIHTLKTHHGGGIIHAKWWENENMIALVDTMTLRNGDNVYLGFEFTTD